MTLPISILNSKHYLWGNDCDGWILFQRDDVSVIQERVPAGCSEVMHYHQFSRQFFFILEGQGTMVLKDQSVKLETGNGLEITPGVPHQFANQSHSEVRFIVISVPNNQVDRIDV